METKSNNNSVVNENDLSKVNGLTKQISSDSAKIISPSSNDLNLQKNYSFQGLTTTKTITPFVLENSNENTITDNNYIKQKFEAKKESMIKAETDRDNGWLVGLDNLGNTCYMNTALQILLHTPLFISSFHYNKELTDTSNTIVKTFINLIQEMSTTSRKSISPSALKSVFSTKNPLFRGYGQHDSLEFLRTLLEDISNGTNRIKYKPPYKEIKSQGKSKEVLRNEYIEYFKSREDSIVTDVFNGQTVNIFTCQECNNETYSFEMFLDITILFDEESFRSSFSIKDLLTKTFKPEKIKFDVPCENCKKKCFHVKTTKFSKLPNVLILTFLRIRSNRKNSSKIEFKENLSLSEFLDKDIKEDSNYNLYGVANHTGSFEFGHYYA